MSVTRIHEDPRVTLPYTDEQWKNIDRLGCRIDQDIAANDIGLTMGGEPTFVSIDNMDGAEWNTAALGPEKRQAGRTAAGPVRNRFAPGRIAALRTGQMVSRRTFAALGADLLLAHGRTADVAGSRVAGGGRQSSTRLARRTRSALPKRWRAGWASMPAMSTRRSRIRSIMCSSERQLPVNVDPVDNHLESAEERERIRHVFERGLDTPVGMILPLQRGAGEERPRMANRFVDAARRRMYF